MSTRRPVRVRLPTGAPATGMTLAGAEAAPSALAESTESASANSSAGSGSLPFPLSAPASRPMAGSTTIAPRSRSVATLCWVAGCSHISVCIAGAYSTGQRAVSSVAVSKSWAMPAAARAIRSAVAGATSTRSAVWPSRTWGTSATSLHTSAATGSPDSAAQVGSPTKRSASGVGMTLTRWPASLSSRSSSQALYAAIPAPTPRMTRAIGGPGLLGLGLLHLEQPLAGLAQRDRQRLLLDAGLDQRADILEQPLAELRVVGVDLARPLRRHDHQLVLAVNDIQK